MTENYNWPRFYKLLCRHGPNLLLEIDKGMREIIEMNAASTDMFWSEGLEELLAAGAADGDMRTGVLSVLELWRENVLDRLDTDFGIELDWELVCLDHASLLIDELVEAASPG